MNKPELIDKMTYKLGRLPRIEVEIAANAIFQLINESLERGERIEIRGFGSFSVKLKKPSMQRNPKSGVTFMGKARHYCHFKPGKLMKDNVNASMELNNE
jgi:integration host factor subunit beta